MAAYTDRSSTHQIIANDNDTNAHGDLSSLLHENKDGHTTMILKFQTRIRFSPSQLQLNINHSNSNNDNNRSSPNNLQIEVEAESVYQNQHYAEQDMGKLVQALSKNHTVQELWIQGDWTGTRLVKMGQMALSAVLFVVGRLPQLQTLILEGGQGSPLLLKQLLQEASKLKKLQMCELKLHGTCSEFQSLGACLQQHSSLTKVHCFSLQVQATDFDISNPPTSLSTNSANNNNLVSSVDNIISASILSTDIATASASQPLSIMDHLIQSLLQNPSLRDFGIWNKINQHLISVSTLLQACSSSFLTSLKIPAWNTSLQLLLLRQVESNVTLKCLDMPLDLSSPTIYAAVTQLLRRNHTLQALRLDVTCDPFCIQPNQQHLIQWAQILARHLSLRKFHLTEGKSSTGSKAATMASSKPRSTNQTTRDEIVNAFATMLETNYLLEDLELLDLVSVSSSNDSSDKNKNNTQSISPALQQIQFLLALNRKGRQSVLRTSHLSPRYWCEQLALFGKDDLDAVRYFLSMNPAVFDHCNSTK